MRFEQLVHLVDLKKSGSIAKTAEDFFISHQAVSKSIKTLEHELSVDLLYRSNRGIEFTAAGMIVYDFAQDILNKRESLEQSLLPFKKREASFAVSKEALCVYATSRFSTESFFGFLKYFNSKKPHVDIAVKSASAEFILSQLQFADNMIAFITINNYSKDNLSNLCLKKNLSYTVLCSKELYVCVHNSSRLAKKEFLPYSEIIDYPSVTFNYPMQLVDEQAPQIHARKYIQDDFEQQKRFLKNFDCYALYTKEEFELLFSKGFCLIPLVDMHDELSVICIHSTTISPIVKQLIDDYITFFK